jgi:hypothetical protein
LIAEEVEMAFAWVRTFSRLKRIALLVAALGSTPYWVAGSAAVRADETCVRETLHSVIHFNDFEVGRPLEQYVTLFGQDFFDAMKRLRPNGHWIDAGAGDAEAIQQYLSANSLRQQLEYLSEEVPLRNILSPHPNRKLSAGERRIQAFFAGANRRREGVSSRAHVTGISYQMKSYGHLERREHRGKLKLITNKYFEEIDDKVILGKAGQADIITDMYGVFAYSPEPDEVLRRYLGLIKKKGEIHLFLGRSTDASNLLKHQVRTSSGKSVPLVDWLKKIPGIKVTHFRNRLFGLPETQSLKITLDPKRAIAVPRLKLVKVTTELRGKTLKPPRRILNEVK